MVIFRPKKPNALTTRRSAVAEGLREALSQWKSCQLLHNCTKKSHLKRTVLDSWRRTTLVVSTFAVYVYVTATIRQLKLYGINSCSLSASFYSYTAWGRGTPFPPLLLPYPFTSSSFALYYFFPLSFSHSLYLFSSIVHPIPIYQNRPTPFPGVRS